LIEANVTDRLRAPGRKGLSVASAEGVPYGGNREGSAAREMNEGEVG